MQIYEHQQLSYQNQKASINIIRHFNGASITENGTDNKHSKREIGLMLRSTGLGKCNYQTETEVEMQNG